MARTYSIDHTRADFEIDFGRDHFCHDGDFAASFIRMVLASYFRVYRKDNHSLSSDLRRDWEYRALINHRVESFNRVSKAIHVLALDILESLESSPKAVLIEKLASSPENLLSGPLFQACVSQHEGIPYVHYSGPVEWFDDYNSQITLDLCLLASALEKVASAQFQKQSGSVESISEESTHRLSFKSLSNFCKRVKERWPNLPLLKRKTTESQNKDMPLISPASIVVRFFEGIGCEATVCDDYKVGLYGNFLCKDYLNKSANLLRGFNCYEFHWDEALLVAFMPFIEGTGSVSGYEACTSSGWVKTFELSWNVEDDRLERSIKGGENEANEYGDPSQKYRWFSDGRCEYSHLYDSSGENDIDDFDDFDDRTFLRGYSSQSTVTDGHVSVSEELEQLILVDPSCDLDYFYVETGIGYGPSIWKTSDFRHQEFLVWDTSH